MAVSDLMAGRILKMDPFCLPWKETEGCYLIPEELKGFHPMGI
jgi:hypothetical protein